MFRRMLIGLAALASTASLVRAQALAPAGHWEGKIQIPDLRAKGFQFGTICASITAAS